VRASAAKRAALRMFPYTQRRLAPQLCCLLLTLAVSSIPLDGMPAPRTSSLITLRTTFVPFDTSIQSPTLTVVEFSVGAPSSKRTDLAANGISFPIPHHRQFACCRVLDKHAHSGAVALVTGRSPPLA